MEYRLQHCENTPKGYSKELNRITTVDLATEIKNHNTFKKFKVSQK